MPWRLQGPYRTRPIRVDVPEGALRTFCEQNAVRELSLFGSVLREDFTPESDIDVLPTRQLTFAVLAQMEDDLERLFHRASISC